MESGFEKQDEFRAGALLVVFSWEEGNSRCNETLTVERGTVSWYYG